MKAEINALDRFALEVSPRWGQNRIRARLAAAMLMRHYEAASTGRRTKGWARSSSDANVANGPALATLRNLSRDLVRNNSWARNGVRTIATNVVGWGITAKPVGGDAGVAALWKAWAESTQCDADGRLNFYGLQDLWTKTIVESGEVLVRRRRRRLEDGLAIPLQLQVLEPDFLDSSKDGIKGQTGGPIVQGVEFDALGQVAAYWLFEQHPGSRFIRSTASRRVAASEIAHSFLQERPGQVRGAPWLASVIVGLEDFDSYEDATLMARKIAPCFVAFVTDVNGEGAALGEPGEDKDGTPIDFVEPGMIRNLKPGEDVKFGTPPADSDNGFSARTLRRIAAGLGVTFEDLTGDYSQVNFSSARMSRHKHWGHVHTWRWNMLIPQLCDRTWGWAMEGAEAAGLIEHVPAAGWTPPPMPVLEPDKEALAAVRRVRGGIATLSEVIREAGGDPAEHLAEYAADLNQLDALGIWLDSDVRRTSQAGLTQARPGAAGGVSDQAKDDAEG